MTLSIHLISQSLAYWTGLILRLVSLSWFAGLVTGTSVLTWFRFHQVTQRPIPRPSSHWGVIWRWWCTPTDWCFYSADVRSHEAKLHNMKTHCGFALSSGLFSGVSGKPPGRCHSGGCPFSASVWISLCCPRPMRFADPPLDPSLDHGFVVPGFWVFVLRILLLCSSPFHTERMVSMKQTSKGAPPLWSTFSMEWQHFGHRIDSLCL